MTTTTFYDLGLPESLISVVDKLGFEHPTDIQTAAIPVLLEGRDVVGIAQTGTGKTAAFGLPLIARLDKDLAEVQALVLAPTRELALQTAAAMESFGAGVIAVYGGSPYGPQLRALKEGTQVVVGTPGRVIDLIKKGALRLDHVHTFVLDEADEMLRMGFAEDVELIASDIPEHRLTALFSATMPRAIARVADTHLHNPVRLEVSVQSTTVDTIHQTYAVVSPHWRFEALSRVLAIREGGTIVFVRTRQNAEEISLDLAAKGFKAAGISGDVPQRDRERLVERLRGGSLDVLVATDVAARGLDVERISLVVNYEPPRETEAYVHRVGRTGRAGRDGESLTFFTPRERHRLRQIENLTGTRMERAHIPSGADVARFIARRKLSSTGNRAIPFEDVLRDAITDAVHAGQGLEEIALRLLATSIGTDAQGPAELTEDWWTPGDKKKRSGNKRKPRRDEDSSFHHRYRLEVGKRDGVSPGAIVGTITGEGDLRGSSVGKVHIFPSFSLVELSENLSSSQVKKIGRATIKGRKLRISVDQGAAPRNRGGRKSR